MESYRKSYQAIKDAIRREMLAKKTATDIMRRAGARMGSGEGEGPPSIVEERGPSLLLTTSPAQPVQRAETAFSELTIRYERLLYDGGWGHEPSISFPYSCAVPEDGVYRVTATAGIWRDDYEIWDREYFGINYFYSSESFYRQTTFARDFLYGSTSRSPSGRPTVYRGVTYDNLLAGMRLQLGVGRNWEGIPGASVPHEHRPDARYSRLFVELVARTGGLDL